MKRWMILFLILMAPSALGRELVDRLEAVVRGEPILHSEIERKISSGQALIVSHYPAKEDASEFEKALQDEINKVLLLKAAEDRKISVSDEELESTLRNYAQDQQGMSLDRLKTAIQQQGFDFDGYQLEFKERLLIQKFQQQVIARTIDVSERSLKAYYLENKGQTNYSVQLKQIRIADSSPHVSKIHEISQKLRDGSLEFDEAIGAYSDLEGEQKYRVTSLLPVADLNPEFQAVIRDLELDEVSNPVHFGDHNYIFKVVRKELLDDNDFEKEKQKLTFEYRAKRFPEVLRLWLKRQRQDHLRDQA